GVLAQQPSGGPIEAPEIDFGAISPVLIILGAACLAVLVEAFVPRGHRWLSQVTLSVVALAAAGIALGGYAAGAPEQGITTLSGAVAVDGPARLLWGTLLGLALPAVLLLAGRSVAPGGHFVRSEERRVGKGGS